MAIEIQAQGDAAIAALDAQQVEVADEQIVTEETTEVSPEESKEVTSETGSDDKQEVEGEEEPESNEPESDYFFNGEPVPKVEIDPEYAAQLLEHGIKAEDLVAELYGKDADFTFKPETRAKLDEAFGKFAVDAWLKGQKMQNEATLMQNAITQKEADEAATARNAEVDEMIGGAEVWDAMSSWAVENLPESEVDAFNDAMNQPNKWLQDIAIKEIHSKYTSSLESSDTSKHTEEPYEATSASSEVGLNAPLTRSDYMKAMQTAAQEHKFDKKAYSEAMSKLDQRRQAGINQGI